MPRRLRFSRAEVAWFVGGFVALQAAFGVAMERWRPQWRDPEYGHKLTALRKRQHAEPDRPLLLALGSSRVLNGFQADRVALPAVDGRPAPLAYNFGLTLHGPLLQHLCLNRLLDDGIRPCWVVLEVAPHLLATGGQGREVVHVERQKWADLAVLREYSGRSDAVYREWAETRAAPLYTSRYTLLSEWLPNWVPWEYRQDFVRTNTRPDGWLPMPEVADPAKRREVCDAMLKIDAEYMRDFAPAPAAERCVWASLDRCRAAGIAAAVVVMPEPTEFRALYRANGEAPLRDFLATLTRDRDIPVFDTREWVADDGFRDPHHLNPRGAIAFTDRFGPELVKWVAGK